MEASTISQVKGEEVTGCPVMHQDFSTTRDLGDYWALANDLRESCPHFYNKYAGGGYWVFTRHEAVKDIYKTPEISPASRSRRGSRTRSTGSCRRRSTRRITSSTAAS